MRIQTTKGCREATPEEADALTAAVQAILDSQCRHVGPIPMPLAAQRLHHRETHLCNRPKGHDGDHARCGHDGTPLVEWARNGGTR